ncbi:MAG TPA: hypothetical protein VFH48_20155 [Chloroflexota bacterium]|nr:hypothetical protein [Chloroflexota bacterium]
MASWGSVVARGVTAGLIAGVPQVVLTQIETGLFGVPREQADIGPRFVRRVTQRFVGTTPDSPTEWLFATLFHFGYAAQWGALYALCQEWRPTPPLVGGSMLAGLIYTLAFSPWGAATQTGTERPPARRRVRETLLHWTAALSFSLTTAFVYEWLRRRREALTPRPPLPCEGEGEQLVGP